MGQSMLAESFAQQMQYLKDNGFVALSIREIMIMLLDYSKISS